MEGRTRRKTLGARTRTNNKLNPHMTPGPEIEPGPRLWETSVLTTVPFLLPYMMFLSVILVWPRCAGAFAVLRFAISKLHPICCNKVAKRVQHVAPNNAAICCVEMLRPFGQFLHNISQQHDTTMLRYVALIWATTQIPAGRSNHWATRDSWRVRPWEPSVFLCPSLVYNLSLSFIYRSTNYTITHLLLCKLSMSAFPFPLPLPPPPL